jgi:hypothetical protein
MNHRLQGIVRNVSPFLPPTPASFLEIDKDIVVPLLHPVISSVSLIDASNAAQRLVAEPVRAFEFVYRLHLF